MSIARFDRVFRLTKGDESKKKRHAKLKINYKSFASFPLHRLPIALLLLLLQLLFVIRSFAWIASESLQQTVAALGEQLRYAGGGGASHVPPLRTLLLLLLLYRFGVSCFPIFGNRRRWQYLFAFFAMKTIQKCGHSLVFSDVGYPPRRGRFRVGLARDDDDDNRLILNAS